MNPVYTTIVLAFALLLLFAVLYARSPAVRDYLRAIAPPVVLRPVVLWLAVVSATVLAAAFLVAAARHPYAMLVCIAALYGPGFAWAWFSATRTGLTGSQRLRTAAAWWNLAAVRISRAIDVLSAQLFAPR